VTDDRWWNRAACRSQNANAAWWLGSAADLTGAHVACTICHACPVQRQCAAEALAWLDRGEELHGVWAAVNVRAASARTQLRHVAAG
jgi:hypothetical protein